MEKVPDGWNDQVSSLYVPNGYTVLLYQDSGFGGVNFASYSQGSYNMPAGYDNQLSSVIISQSQSAVATTATATNTTAAVTATTTAPTTAPATAPANTNTTVAVALPLNANIVATLVLPVNAPAAQAKPADRKCPTFYRDIDQQGDSFVLCSSGNVPSSWDNQVSSFYVPPGYYVKLYPNRKYGGRNFGPIHRAFMMFPVIFNDQLSSVLMIKR